MFVRYGRIESMGSMNSPTPLRPKCKKRYGLGTTYNSTFIPTGSIAAKTFHSGNANLFPAYYGSSAPEPN